jgi:vanillate O-demethylase monooxygenase subunit
MRWPLNAWYVVAYSQEITAESLVQRRVLGQKIVLFRDGRGKAAALRDRCPHRGVPLSMGRLCADGAVACIYHGLRFDPSGKCIENPHSRGAIASALHVTAFPTAERYGMLWIWMGEQAADEEQLPVYDQLVPGSGYDLNNPASLVMHAPADLVIDNLMDLSHASFLHDGLLGNQHMLHDTKTKVVETTNGVSAIREFSDKPLPEYHNLIFLGNGQTGKAWQNAHWRAPSCVAIDNGVHELGSDPDTGGHIWAVHAITPETEETSLYHIVAGRRFPASRRANESAILARLAELRTIAFTTQDDPVIQAQFLTLKENRGDFKLAMLPIDAGPVRWRRVLERQLAATGEPTWETPNLAQMS